MLVAFHILVLFAGLWSVERNGEAGRWGKMAAAALCCLYCIAFLLGFYFMAKAS